MDDSLEAELLATRLDAQRLSNVLPECEERRGLRETIAACDILLKMLQSGTVTPQGMSEMRRAYEGWKRDKRDETQSSGATTNVN